MCDCHFSLSSIITPRNLANGFNNYFTSIASKLNGPENGLLIEPLPKYTDYIKNSVESSIFMADSSPEKIKEIIKELSSNKASDILLIFYHFLYFITSYILSLLIFYHFLYFITSYILSLLIFYYSLRLSDCSLLSY